MKDVSFTEVLPILTDADSDLPLENKDQILRRRSLAREDRSRFELDVVENQLPHPPRLAEAFEDHLLVAVAQNPTLVTSNDVQHVHGGEFQKIGHRRSQSFRDTLHDRDGGGRSSPFDLGNVRGADAREALDILQDETPGFSQLAESGPEQTA
jgi:hypothetical protein